MSQQLQQQDRRQEKTEMPPIPVTIVTGFLGSGKTTILLNLIPQLPPTYRLALLKNEFGEVAVDSQLASARAVSGVRELLNGCICCNLVGQLGDALKQLKEEVKPDRIVIETSGSAFPATLAMEVNRVSRESCSDSDDGPAFELDGVVSVIDVENWEGYEDTSYTAKLQARYTDLIVFNKWEDAGERKFDICLDRVGDMEVETASVKSSKGWVHKDVLLGLDGALISKALDNGAVNGAQEKTGHEHDNGDHGNHQSEVEVLSVTLSSGQELATIDTERLASLLSSAPKDEVYRIKGIVRCSTENPPQDSSPSSSSSAQPDTVSTSSTQNYILNWAFGRWTFTPAPGTDDSAASPDGNDTSVARLTFILAQCESTKWKSKLEAGNFIELCSKEKGVLQVEKIG